MDEIEDSELKPEWPLDMVPVREDMEMPGLAMSVSARSNTLPWKTAANDPV